MTQTLVPPRERVAPAPQPRAPAPERPHRPPLDRRTPSAHRPRRAGWVWALVVLAVVAAAALAVVTFSGRDDGTAVVGTQTELIEQGSIRAIEGSTQIAPVTGSHTGLIEQGSVRALDR
jgi:anti-sigma-K factor RskA